MEFAQNDLDFQRQKSRDHRGFTGGIFYRNEKIGMQRECKRKTEGILMYLRH